MGRGYRRVWRWNRHECRNHRRRREGRSLWRGARSGAASEWGPGPRRRHSDRRPEL